MTRLPAAVLPAIAVWIGLGSIPSRLRAEHDDILLTLETSGKKVEASADTEPPAGGLKKRPVLKVNAGDPLVFQFIMTNVYPHEELKDVKVRYFVIAFDEDGAKTERKATRAITEGSFTLNFKEKGRAGARMRFKAPGPGRYLVRVETQNTHSDHEHFSAVELVVEK